MKFESRVVYWRGLSGNFDEMLPSFRPLLAPRSSSGYRYFSEITNKPVRRNTKLGENRPIIQAQRKRNAEHEARAAEMGLGWRIVGST